MGPVIVHGISASEKKETVGAGGTVWSVVGIGGDLKTRNVKPNNMCRESSEFR
jgi:hypothetical protein